MHGKFFIIFLSAGLLINCKHREKFPIDLDSNPDTLEVFAPFVISTGLYERDIAISSDNKEVFYTLGDYRQIRRILVRVSQSESGWDRKEVLDFSGMYDDIEPFLSTDGKKLYFVSNRPVNGDTTRQDYNIWFVERTADGWTTPEPLPDVINSVKDEFYPSVAANGNIYFTATRQIGPGSEDIFLSKFIDGKYTVPEPLDSAVNTVTYEFNAYVTPDESLIVFSSYGRKDDLGGGDLYYSLRDSSGRWLQAVNMGTTVNSEKLDYCPFIDSKRGNFYFTSERNYQARKRFKSISDIELFANRPMNGAGDIYRITIDEIFPAEKINRTNEKP